MYHMKNFKFVPGTAIVVVIFSNLLHCLEFYHLRVEEILGQSFMNKETPKNVETRPARKAHS